MCAAKNDSRANAASPTSLQYWHDRLVRRPYTEPARPNSANEYFARIEHDGRWWFFPLDSDVPRTAAAKAREIYLTVAQGGWEAACHYYSREITIAVFWLPDPLACTYATIFTQPSNGRFQPLPPGGAKRGAVRLAVIEPEDEIRSALLAHIHRMPGYECVMAGRHGGELLEANVSKRPEVVLFNQALPEAGTAEFNRLSREVLSAASFFRYGVYKNSDELFVTITGVEGGYFLRRREPLSLFDPISDMRTGRRVSGAAHGRAQAYFRALVGMTAANNEPRLAATLTDREYEILNCVSNGITTDKDIASALHISTWTVSAHWKNIFARLDVHSRTEAVMRFLQR